MSNVIFQKVTYYLDIEHNKGKEKDKWNNIEICREEKIKAKIIRIHEHLKMKKINCEISDQESNG